MPSYFLCIFPKWGILIQIASVKGKLKLSFHHHWEWGTCIYQCAPPFTAQLPSRWHWKEMSCQHGWTFRNEAELKNILTDEAYSTPKWGSQEVGRHGTSKCHYHYGLRAQFYVERESLGFSSFNHISLTLQSTVTPAFPVFISVHNTAV